MNRQLAILLTALGALLAATLVLILSYREQDTRKSAYRPAPELLHRLLRQAEQLRTEKKFQEAERRLQQLLKFEPESPAALLQLGVLNFEQEKYREAELIFRRLLARNVRDPVLHNNLGQTLVRQKQYAAGIRSLLYARQLAPEMEVIDLNLAIAFEQAGDEENARKFFDEFNAVRQRRAEREMASGEKPAPPEGDAASEQN